MTKDYYKEYFTYERENWWFKVRYKILDHFINRYAPPQRPLKILNIGAATGHSTELLMKYGDVSSIEYDAECCEYTREKLGIPIQQGSILELPFENDSFDLVCAFDVLEHVENDQLGTDEMNRVCKNSGIAIITVPAFMSLWSKHDEINFHFRRYTGSQVQSLFRSFRMVHGTYFNTFLFPLIYLFRSIARKFPNYKRSGTGSDFSVIPKDSLINNLFFSIFKLEFYTLRFLKYPFGVSYLYVGKKE